LPDINLKKSKLTELKIKIKNVSKLGGLGPVKKINEWDSKYELYKKIKECDK
jgi:hypothetical protein